MTYERSTCTACRAIGIVLAGIIVVGIVMNIPDIAKFIKLKAMSA